MLLATVPTALASTTWYVNGLNGSDSDNCSSVLTPCKTIKHVILRAASGDTITVGSATYRENLRILKNLTITGVGARTTIVDGGGVGPVVSIPSISQKVTLSGMTFRNGRPAANTICCVGITNSGTLTLSDSLISGNVSNSGGGGIGNGGTLTLTNDLISGNAAYFSCSRPICFGSAGAGIYNSGRMVINNSTISGNTMHTSCPASCFTGAGISNRGGTVTIQNSTISGNRAPSGGASAINLFLGGTVAIINSTVSGNSSPRGTAIYGPVAISNSTISGNNGAGIYAATLQNSILANNSSANCVGSVTSKGYNLSSDDSCAFNGPGDLNNIDPMLGPLRANGGPTKTMALLPGSPAIDAGYQSGCTDGQGHLLKTDQRGMPRPDWEDKTGCDMGAYEHQGD